ncbi:MAG TPA: hypothetical protein VGL56_00390 [Fimbriimonadaceae bacterium]|jgi:hypothetical protein
MNLLLSLVGFTLLAPIQASTRPFVGYIDKINGNAVFLTPADTKAAILLKRTDEKRLLRDQDVIRCGPESAAIVFVSGKRMTVTSGKSLRAVEETPSVGTKGEWFSNINEIFKVGGIHRAGNERTPIWSPTSDTCVISSTFKPGYEPGDESEVSVLRTNDTPVWTYKDNGKALPDGEIANLRKELLKVQQESTRVSLVFSIQYASSQAKSSFILLSGKEEAVIEKKLADCDKIADPFQRECARAAVFVGASLVNDQVTELEKLSAMYSESQDLREQMQVADKAIGKTP